MTSAEDMRVRGAGSSYKGLRDDTEDQVRVFLKGGQPVGDEGDPSFGFETQGLPIMEEDGSARSKDLKAEGTGANEAEEGCQQTLSVSSTYAMSSPKTSRTESDGDSDASIGLKGTTASAEGETLAL